MREVEVKVAVKDFKPIEIKLKKLGIVLGEKLTQHDVVFGEPGAVDNQLNSNWLRIRTENENKVYFTLKRSIVGHLDSLEHEVVVDDAKELESIIKNVNYELYSDLTKVRRKAKYQSIEICLDEVPGLGLFLEVEKLVDVDSSHDNIVSELWELLMSLGISKDQEVHEGYDVLERKTRVR